MTVNIYVRRSTRLHQKIPSLLFVFIMPFFVSACSSGISLTYTPPAAEETAFEYYQKIKTLPDEELAMERSRVEMDTSHTDGGVNAVKLAVLLSVQERADSKNDEVAMALLENLQNSAQREAMSADYKIFSDHWLALLRQRQKVREYAALYQQAQEVQQELQRSYAQLDEKYAGLAKLLASMAEQNTLLTKQNVLMQQQIEALTSIEQQLAEREQTQSNQ